MLELRQSTACTVKLGPFPSVTDGSPLTSLTIDQSDVRLSKNGGDIAQKNESSSCTHDELSIYNCALNTTDTNTLGRLQIYVYGSGGVVIPHDFEVVTANYYDTKYSTDSFDVNLNANQSAATIGTVTTLTNKTGFSLAADQSGVTVGTVNTVTNKTGFALSSSGVDAIWDEVTSGHQTTGTVGLTLLDIYRLLTNKRDIISDTETCYEDNGVTARWQWTLNSESPPYTSKTPV